MVEYSILIGSRNGPYLAIRIAKVDHSRTDFTDLCFKKIFQRKLFGVKENHVTYCLTKNSGETSARRHDKNMMFSSTFRRYNCAILLGNWK